MTRPAKPPPHEAEARRLLEQSYISRYLKVLAVGDGDVIEVVPRPGHRITIVHAATDDGPRITRFLIGPLHKPKKTAPSGT